MAQQIGFFFKKKTVLNMCIFSDVCVELILQWFYINKQQLQLVLILEFFYVILTWLWGKFEQQTNMLSWMISK